MKIEMNRFDDIEHMPLRVYNRATQLYNLLQDFGEQTSREYLNMFDQGERKQMFLMIAYLKQHGKDATMKFVTKGMKFEYNPNAEVENV